jgi:hypothetical protein
MAQLARILGEIWLCMLSLCVIVFSLIVIVTEGSGEFWALFNPFNLRDWGLVLILALPGIGLLVLAKSLRR